MENEDLIHFISKYLGIIVNLAFGIFGKFLLISIFTIILKLYLIYAIPTIHINVNTILYNSLRR